MAEEKNTQERLVWAVAVCRERGLRRTKAMKELLRVLIEAKGPLTLSDLCGVQSLSEQCDKATVFRLLGRLQEKGVIRRLGLHERAAYYAFAYPGEHFD